MSFIKTQTSSVVALSICVLAATGSVPAAVAGTAADINDAVAQFGAQSADKPILIAQACSTCGAEIADVLAVGEVSVNKRKNEALTTDSLWGNLILDMAYQRDKQLAKIMRRMNIVNTGTMAAVTGIAAGTLAQGVVALGTLNPPEGKQDSYVPGAIGIGLSTATIVTFAARAYYGHKIQTQIRTKQLVIKDRVESVLNHLERSNCKCVEATNDLTELVGPRATSEWVQLWRSSHKLASTATPRISLGSSPETK